MIKFCTFIGCLLMSVCSYSQTIKADARPDSLKFDNLDEYQTAQISKLDLLHALNSLGVRVFNCQFSPRFTKTYKLKIEVEEFVNGKAVGVTNISPNDNNLYFFWEGEKQYANYLDKINLIARDADSVSVLSVNLMGNSTGMRLKKQTVRKNQFYSWRRYSKPVWKLNAKTPFLVYSSSWHDKQNNIERYCGAVDLSLSQAATKELMDLSPHYFVVSYTVSE
jgi:hypothetical protein